MLTEVEGAELKPDSGDRVVASGALWLSPQDLPDAQAWTESHFGAWDTLFRNMPLAQWSGLFEVSYEQGQALADSADSAGTRGIPATLSLRGWSGPVLVQSTNVSRRPAVWGEARWDESAWDDSEGSWLLRLVGTGEAPAWLNAVGPDSGDRTDAPSPHAQAEPNSSAMPLEPDEEALLSRWSAQLAAGDPKAFATVVRDVITRMNRISDSDAPLTVRLHASAAAQSLEIVRAGLTGEIPVNDAAAAKESLSVLLARLAALGLVAKYPQMGILVAAGELILAHWRATHEGNTPVMPPESSATGSLPSQDSRVLITIVDAPDAAPPRGIAPITARVTRQDGTPIERARVRATAYGGTFQRNREGRWEPLGQSWAGETSSSGEVTVNMQPDTNAQTLLIEFASEGGTAEHRLPVRSPA